jgi:O-antigen ligase
MDIIINFRFFSFTRTFSINRQWLQYGIIAFVILVSTTVSFWGSQTLFTLLLVLIGAVTLLVVLLKQPTLGFILVILSAMFVKYDGPSGLSAAMVLVALMFGLWILEMFVVRRNFQFIRSRIMQPILVFLVISILAFFVGQIPWFVFAHQAPLDAQVAGFAIFIFSIAALLLSAHLIRDINWLKGIVWTFIGLSAVYIISRVFELEAVFQLYHFAIIAQSMFWTWLVALTVAQILFNNELGRWVKVLLLVLVVLTLYVGMVKGQDWKSGWVPPLVAVIVLVGLRYRRFIIFAMPFILIGAVYITMDLLGSEDYSWGTRVDAWRIILEIARISPLLGMGFANYYWYTPLFPIRGWRVSFNSHSQFVDLIAETGYIGLLAFVWLFFELGRLIWRMTKQQPAGFPQAYANGAFAGLCATIVASFLGDWLLPFVYNVSLPGFRGSVLPWIFLGGAIALDQIRIRTIMNVDNDVQNVPADDPKRHTELTVNG